jgi:hypothetical protein
MRRTLLWWGFLSGVLFAALLVAGYSFLMHVREEFQSFICSQNLKHAGLLFYDYQKEHLGKFPRRIEELDLKRLENTYHPTLCPKARTLGAQGFLYLQPREGAPDDTPILLCWRHPKLWGLLKRGGVRTR